MHIQASEQCELHMQVHFLLVFKYASDFENVSVEEYADLSSVHWLTLFTENGLAVK